MASTFVLPVLMGWQIRKSHHSVQYQLVTQTDSENQPPNDLARGGTENPSLSRPMIWRGEATKTRPSTRFCNQIAITNIKKKSGGLNFFGKGPMAEKLQCRFRVFLNILPFRERTCRRPCGGPFWGPRRSEFLEPWAPSICGAASWGYTGPRGGIASR